MERERERDCACDFASQYLAGSMNEIGGILRQTLRAVFGAGDGGSWSLRGRKLR